MPGVRTTVRLIRLVAALLLLEAGPLAAQDSSVHTDEARPFLGEWSATLQGPQGPIDLGLDLIDDRGQVIGHSWTRDGRLTLVEEIMKSGQDLVLGYRMNIEGEGHQIELTLSADGEDLRVTLNAGGSGLTAVGIATRR